MKLKQVELFLDGVESNGEVMVSIGEDGLVLVRRRKTSSKQLVVLERVWHLSMRHGGRSNQNDRTSPLD